MAATLWKGAGVAGSIARLVVVVEGGGHSYVVIAVPEPIVGLPGEGLSESGFAISSRRKPRVAERLRFIWVSGRGPRSDRGARLAGSFGANCWGEASDCASVVDDEELPPLEPIPKVGNE